MSRMRIILGIFEKQAKDLLKNLQVLILFFVYPIVVLILITEHFLLQHLLLCTAYFPQL